MESEGSNPQHRLPRRALLKGALAVGGAWLAPRAFASDPANSPGRDGCIRLPAGRQLGYSEYGDPRGPLVLYFHGTPGARTELGLIAAEVAAAGVRGVSVDRPGGGLSSYQPSRRILDWPADVAALVDALGYAGTAFGIVGVSGGAPYALACLACMPERLTHVAVVSGHTPMNAPGVTPGSQDQLLSFLTRRPRLGAVVLKAAIGRLHRKPDKFLNLVLRRLADSDRRLINSSAANRRLMLRTLNEASRYGPYAVLQGVQLLGSDWGFQLNCLDGSRVSVWQGGCDPITPPSMGEYFHRQLAGSDYDFDPQAGHLTMAKWHAAEILGRFR